MRQFEDLSGLRSSSAEFEVAAFIPCGLQQTHHRSEAAAVDEFDFLQLEDDVAIFFDRILHLRVQGENFVATDDTASALDNEDLTDGTTLQAQLHRASANWRECYVSRPSKSTNTVKFACRASLTLVHGAHIVRQRQDEFATAGRD